MNEPINLGLNNSVDFDQPYKVSVEHDGISGVITVTVLQRPGGPGSEVTRHTFTANAGPVMVTTDLLDTPEGFRLR